MYDDIKDKFNNIVNSDGDVMIEGTAIVEYLNTHYTDFNYNMESEKNHDQITNADIVNAFISDYNLFVSRELANLERIYQAYTVEYRPLDNYDKNSTITTKIEGKETDNKSGSEKHNNGAMHSTSVNSVSPENNNNFYGKEKDEANTDAITNETFFNNIKNEKTYTDRKDIVTEHTYGNIGVTTSMQMLTAEIEGRSFVLLKYFCSLFACDYLTPMPVVDHECNTLCLIPY